MKFDIAEHLRAIPQCRQTQRSLKEQLADLAVVANRLGLYDASDHLRGILTAADKDD